MKALLNEVNENGFGDRRKIRELYDHAQRKFNSELMKRIREITKKNGARLQLQNVLAAVIYTWVCNFKGNDLPKIFKLVRSVVSSV